MATFPVRIFAALLLALIAVQAPAQTYTYCAGDSQTLANDLAAATQVSGDVNILLVGGVTYDVSNTAWTTGNHIKVQHAVRLMGGYTDGTCTNRSLNVTDPAVASIVDGGGQWASLYAQGVLRVEGVRFQNFNPVEFGIQGVPYQKLSLLNNFFDGVYVKVDSGLSNNNQLFVLDNLVRDSPNHGLYVFVADNTDQATIAGNTVVNSVLHGIHVEVEGAIPSLVNNIAWGNHGYDISVGQCGNSGCNEPAPVYMDRNIFGAGMLFGSMSAGSVEPPGLNNDPQFVGGGDYHVQSTSPAINAGDGADGSILTATDLDGNPRVVGSAPDVGGYESSINDVAAATLTVTNANDSGAGSLRQAIIDANASGGTHYIEFDIPGSCPQVISLDSDLPYISISGLSINGFTQPGSKKNTYPNGDIANRCIVLNGEGRSQSMGLTFYGASSGFYWVQGLAFEGWSIALNMSAGQGNLVWGNQFGGSLWNSISGPLALSANTIDIWLWGGTTTTTVGGSDPADRNIIDSASSGIASPQPNYEGRGIAISSGGGSSRNAIVNNIIGLDNFESTTPYGNAIGIQLETANNAISGNVIGNNNNGIQVLGSGANNNWIDGNLFGISEPLLCIFGPCPSANAEPNQAALYFWQGANGNWVTNNTVTNNTLFGIELTGAGTALNLLYGNSIYGNPASWASNGAEVNLDGYAYGTIYSLTATLPPNDYLNYPVLTGAVGSSSTGTISGYLQSTNGTYMIQAYSSPTCEAGGAVAYYSTGQVVIADQDTTHHVDGSGNFSFSFTSPVSLTGRYITATAIDVEGNTSEFSACKLYQCDVIFRHAFEGSVGETCP